MELYQWALVVIAAMSLITFITYGVDKAKAKMGAWRVPEKVLLGMSFLFGALGGYAGMLAFRHKTKHWYFQVVNILSLALHTALVVYLTTLVG